MRAASASRKARRRAAALLIAYTPFFSLRPAPLPQGRWNTPDSSVRITICRISIYARLTQISLALRLHACPLGLRGNPLPLLYCSSASLVVWRVQTHLAGTCLCISNISRLGFPVVGITVNVAINTWCIRYEHDVLPWLMLASTSLRLRVSGL